MRAALAVGLTLTLTAGTPLRRPLATPTKSGWALVTLDADAQRQRDSLWISDGEGRALPFEVVHQSARSESERVLADARLGSDAKGRPTAAFTVPTGGATTLRLSVEAKDRPWISRVQLERLGPGASWITWEPRPRPHVWQWGTDEEGLRVGLPAEAGPWRLTLLPVVGRSPRLTGLSLASQESSWRLETRETLKIPTRPESSNTWQLEIPAGEDVQGLEVRLRPPAAAIWPELLLPVAPVEGRPQPPRSISHSGALWNLPALDSEGTRLDLQGGFRGGTLLLRLPEGAEPEAVEARCGRATLGFPAESGKSYFLHLGSGVKVAPGSLAGLSSGLDPQTAETLTLGAPQPDPQAVAETTPQETPWDRIAKGWPWAVGALTLVLAFLGMRLMKAPPEG